MLIVIQPKLEQTFLWIAWLEEKGALEAFNAVKVALCSPPVLRFPDFSKPFILLVDACGGENGGYGACLAQIDNAGQEYPVAFGSTGLTKAQRKFASSEAETAAMMHFLRKWRCYCQGNITIVVTDHSAINSLLKPNKQFKNRKLASWAAELGEWRL